MSGWNSESPLKLVFLTQTYPRFDGDTAGPFIRDLAKGLVEGGDRVIILTPHAPGVRTRWIDHGIQVETFRYAPENLELIGYSRSLSADEAIKWQAAAVTPLFGIGALRALRQIVTTEKPDLVHAHWAVPNGLIAAAANLSVPFGIGLHGSDVFLAEKPAIRSLMSQALARSRFLTGCSPELVDRICALGFDSERSAVIPYGVDTDTFKPTTLQDDSWRRELGIDPKSLMVLAVGRMVTKKGFHVLIPALARLLKANRDLHIVFGGEGDRLDELRQSASTISDRIHFPGILLRDTLPDLYRSADIFVLPAIHDSKGNVDGLPNVILEAMASGLPVVASKISGIPLAITDGQEGFLVEEQSEKALEGALKTLLENKDLRLRMGIAARQKAEAELTWSTVAAQYRLSYQKALNPAVLTT